MIDNFQKTIQFYNDHADAFEKKTKDRQKHRLIHRFVASLPAKGSVLDLGCAFGRDLRFFINMGLQAVGVDGSTVMIERARTLVPEAVLCVGDIQMFPFHEWQFVGVWATGIFVHIPKKDMFNLLQKIFRCLPTNGILCGSLYLGDSEGMERDERYSHAEKYYSYFNMKEFRSLLLTTGFSLVVFESKMKDTYERADTLDFLAKKL